MVGRIRILIAVVGLVALGSGCTIYGWGWNSSGQLGDSFTVDRASPTPVSRNPGWVVADAGYDHSCAVDQHGRLWCWGSHGQGALGQGASPLREPDPIEVDDATDWQAVSTGHRHTCAIKSTGTLWCWGNHPGVSQQNVAQIGAFADWRSISAGPRHTCGIRGSGSLWCWGQGDDGELGLGTGTPSATAPQQVGAATDWKLVSTGTNHTCGVRAPGHLYCWGSNSSGQLGVPSVAAATIPVRVDLATDWSAVSAGQSHSCGIRRVGGAVGQLFCWGSNDHGEIGDGTDEPRNLPTPIGYEVDWTDVGAGGDVSCAIRAGATSCWGSNEFGQVGDNSTIDRDEPTLVPGTGWLDVSVGEIHVIGTRDTVTG